MLALADNQCAWLMQPDGQYERIKPAEKESITNMQNMLIERYRQ